MTKTTKPATKRPANTTAAAPAPAPAADTATMATQPTDIAGADPVVLVPVSAMFGTMALFKRLELAQGLPEVKPDEVEHEIEPGPEFIHHFKGVDRRTMRIVMAHGGFAAVAVEA